MSRRSACKDRSLNPMLAWTAPRDGWYIVVVDGSSAFDDEGTYDLTVKLTCARPGCGCP